MGLFERAAQLDALAGAVGRIAADDGGASGAVVTVAGDAGAGKTSLIAAALAALPARARVLRAACDPLSTPRPLGPIRDVQAALGDAATAENLLGVEARFTASVSAAPTVLVIDDVQWIDAASVEVLRFLVRRIESLPVILVLAHREVPLGHVLLALLGDAARMESTVHVTVPPLSATAVREILGDRGADADHVVALTGGNPFFVAEIARHPGEELPRTIRDAVVSSTTGLAEVELDALQLMATAPDAFDDRLLPYVGLDVPTLRRLEATGLLVRTPHGIAFRHELARLAIVASTEPGVEPLLHRRILDAWERVGSSDDAVLTHHAVAAGDPERTLRYAARAAEDATRTGSHTEAVAFLTLALAQLDADTAERARLLEELSTEQYMVSRLPASLSSIDAALRIRERLGDHDGISTARDRRAVVEYYSARRREAERDAEAAAAAVGASPAALASAQATRAYLAYRRHDLERAREIAAGQRESPTTDAASLRLAITEAAADLVEGRTSARERLLRHASAALQRSLDEVGTTAYSNLSAIDIEHRRLADAETVLAEAIPLTVDRDIPICRQWQTGMRSRLHLLRGRWAASAEDAAAVLDGSGAPLAAVWPHIVSALLAMRRGETDAAVTAHLDRAWTLAAHLDETLVSLAVRSAAAEFAWHRGPVDPRLEDAATHLATAERLPGTQWAAGDLRVWLRRLGRDIDAGPSVPEPYRLELEGRHAEAAGAWRALGAPFDAAMAAVHSADPDVAATGLASLDALDVGATAACARAMLMGRGIRSLPARPRSGTLANPSGLTNRQLDVARLVAQGLTNAELAERLYISPKTADHHVSAVLGKLGMSSRRDIVRAAATLGLD